MLMDIFKFKTPDEQKLLEMGFVKRDSKLFYETDILGGQFSLQVVVQGNEVKSAAIDKASGEEYALYRVEGAQGEFVGKVRQAAEAVLEDICQKAFKTEVFASRQAKVLLAAAEQRFGDRLEFLWPKFPTDAILRRKDTEKWYAVFMIIPKSKLGPFGSELIDVVDVRVASGQADGLIDQKAIFAGYHMNKKSWITITLDSGASDQQILELLENSYNLAAK